MFASGEALYQRLSPSFAAYLETLEAVHSGDVFIQEVRRNGGGLYQGERGSPFNNNQDLQAIHPVVRTSKLLCPFGLDLEAYRLDRPRYWEQGRLCQSRLHQEHRRLNCQRPDPRRKD